MRINNNYSRITAFVLALTAAAIVSNISCKHYPFLPDDSFPIQPPLPDIPCSPDSVYFQNSVFPLIISNCAKSGCHDAVTHQEGINLSTYSDIMKNVVPGNPNNSKLYRMITDPDIADRMPPSGNTPLTQEQISMIYKWIQQGALNNGCGGGLCDSSNITYSLSIVPIINTNCVGCHSDLIPGGGIDLSEYPGVRAIALNGKLHGSIHHLSGYQPMPQGGQLSKCDISKMDIWIRLNAPNN